MRTIFEEETRILSWDTRAESFSECTSPTTDTVVPMIGQLHPAVTVQNIRDWYLPLEVNDDTADPVVMA